MGTWDDGIYDNDSALDTLWSLVKLDGDEPDAVRLVARIGLLAWLNPVSVRAAGPLRERVAALGADELARVPAASRAALERLLDDPEVATADGSRSRAAEAAIGGYSDGPRIDALLRFPGAQATIEALADRCAGALDRVMRADRDGYELAGELAALGVLIELAEAGLWRPEAARVQRWRDGLAAIDRRTREERSFWWKYFRRVRVGLDLLAPAPPGAARPSVREPAAPVPAGPEERYAHAKFGVGVLVGRSGAGDTAAVELRFADGEVRKILARFVTAVDGA
ncbi:MAG: hypothetical protein JNL82_13600 [Myxococcales bacterium]|nr:hypothetical protein [Myxococcales bacterium]